MRVETKARREEVLENLVVLFKQLSLTNVRLLAVSYAARNSSMTTISLINFVKSESNFLCIKVVIGGVATNFCLGGTNS